MEGLVYQNISNETPQAIRLLGTFIPHAAKYCIVPCGMINFSDATEENVSLVDLKLRQIDAKPFPDELDMLPFSFVDEAELVNDDCFPANSASANFIMQFCHDIFEGGRQTFDIPVENTSVKFEHGKYYIELAAAICEHGAGTMRIEISKQAVVIRCSGKTCKAQGKRLSRPNRTAVGIWDLSFLFFKASEEDQIKRKKRKVYGTSANFYPVPPPGYGYLLVKLKE
jgi:hypothetical protein